MLPTNSGVTWPVGSEEEAKNRFSGWQPCRTFWILDQNDFNYFDLLITLMLPSSFKPIYFLFQVKMRKIGFQDDGHLVYSIGAILATFYLQVTPMLPTKFHVNWPFFSGEEVKNKFLRWWPWQPSWILDWNHLT